MKEANFLRIQLDILIAVAAILFLIMLSLCGVMIWYTRNRPEDYERNKQQISARNSRLYGSILANKKGELMKSIRKSQQN